MSSRPIRQKKYDPGKDPNLEKEILEDVKTTKDASEEVPSLKETKKRDKERVQFDFAPEALDRIDDMKDRIGATTRAEVIRQALRVLEWFITETEPNDTITISNSDNEIIAKFKARLLHD